MLAYEWHKHNLCHSGRWPDRHKQSNQPTEAKSRHPGPMSGEAPAEFGQNGAGEGGSAQEEGWKQNPTLRPDPKPQPGWLSFALAIFASTDLRSLIGLAGAYPKMNTSSFLTNAGYSAGQSACLFQRRFQLPSIYSNCSLPFSSKRHPKHLR